MQLFSWLKKGEPCGNPVVQQSALKLLKNTDPNDGAKTCQDRPPLSKNSVGTFVQKQSVGGKHVAMAVGPCQDGRGTFADQWAARSDSRGQDRIQVRELGAPKDRSERNRLNPKNALGFVGILFPIK